MKRIFKLTTLFLMLITILTTSVGYAQTSVSPEPKPPKITKLNSKIVKEIPTVAYADIILAELGKSKKEVLNKIELKTEVVYLEEDQIQDPTFKEIRLLDKDKKFLGRLMFKNDKLVMANAMESYKDVPASKAQNSSRHRLQEEWGYARFDLLAIPGAIGNLDQSDTTIIDEITFKNSKGIIHHVRFIDYLDSELDEGITTLEFNGYLNQQIFDEIPKG